MQRHTDLGHPALAMLAAAVLAAAVLGAAMLASTASPAAAQVGGIGRSPFLQGAETPSSAVAKPSGLPGARRGQAAVAPAERSALDMPPTEALFDAVNRGDMASARDAISRGADLQGRNILGLTPLELAIDLGRNELTFLLLSMRGAASAGAPPAHAAGPAAPRAAPARAPAATPPATPAATPPATPVAAAPRIRQNGAAAVGTPAPQAGFLGFGAPIR